MPVLPGAPDPGEYNPAFAGYVDQARPFGDPIEQLAAQLADVLALFGALLAEKRGYRYAPGKWSVQQLLGHIIDTERVFAYRLLRIARADATPLAGFNENDYAATAEAESCDWDALMQEFTHVRQSTILLLRHLPAAAWVRAGVVNGAPLSVRAQAYILFGHVAHHLEILRCRYL